MSDNEIIKQLTDDAQEWRLEYELNEFINDNPNDELPSFMKKFV